MRYAITAMAIAAVTQSAEARADGTPSWTDRATRIVTRIRVPERVDITARDKQISERHGSGFLVGSRDQTVYLVTAGHVIWPDGLPDSKENVKLDVMLRDCDVWVPAVADSTQASGPLDSALVSGPAVVDSAPVPVAISAQAGTREDLDVALVKINLTDIPSDVRARCQGVLAHLEELPRHIIDPDADRLSRNTPAWLIGPGIVFNGRVPRRVTFEKYDGNMLKFGEAFTPGDSGSPVFSDRGHIIGMAVTDTGEATRFSMILTRLEQDWEKPTNLAGRSSRLWFSDQFMDKSLSIDRAPHVPLQRPHPAPQGQVALKLWIDDAEQVVDTVDIAGTDMDCEVATARWLAVHRRAAIYTTLVLAAATGVALAIAKTSENSFEQLPTRTSYDRVRLFSAITIGTGSAALTSLSATAVSYLLSDTTGITCSEKRR